MKTGCPLAEFELPDGTVLEAPDGADPRKVVAGYKAHLAGGPPKENKKGAAAPESPTSAMNLVGAATEPLMSMASGAVGQVAGGLAGLGAAGTNALGITNTPAADVVNKVQGAMTYEPHTEGGKNAMSVIGAPGEMIEKGSDWAGKKTAEGTGSPLAGAGVKTALQAIPQLLGMKGAKAGAAGMTKAVEASPMVDVARKAGYVLKPSEAGGKVGKVAEGMSGSPKLSVDASIKNQRVTDRLAAEDIGIPKGKKPTKAAIDEAKKPHNAVYKEMGELGDMETDAQYKADLAKIGRNPGTSFSKAVNPDLEKMRDTYDEPRFDAKDAVLKVRELRAKGNKNIKAPNAPEQNELGYAQRQIADAIEGQMERRAAQLGKSDLVQRFKSARQSLAKIHVVEAAIKGNTAEVSAPAIAAQLNRGAPLTGNLKTIADVANEFGEVTRPGRTLKNKVPVTVLEGLPALGGAALTAASHPHIGVPLMAGVAGRPLTRRALLSQAYQKRLQSRAAKPKVAAPLTAAGLAGGALAAPGSVDQNGVGQ